MAKTAVRNPKQIAQIAFTVDKNGKPRAYRVSLRQMRYFPIGYDEAELMVSTGQAEKVPYRPFGAKASKPNPKVPIVDLTKRVVSSGKLAGSGFRKKEVDPTEVEKEWKRVAVVHNVKQYGEPVQRMLRSEFETAFWRGAARGLANPASKTPDWFEVGQRAFRDTMESEPIRYVVRSAPAFRGVRDLSDEEIKRIAYHYYAPRPFEASPVPSQRLPRQRKNSPEWDGMKAEIQRGWADAAKAAGAARGLANPAEGALQYIATFPSEAEAEQALKNWALQEGFIGGKVYLDNDGKHGPRGHWVMQGFLEDAGGGAHGELPDGARRVMLLPSLRATLRNPQPKVTDRALRYRANANPPKGPKRCLFCGSTRNVEVGHLNGHEEDNSPSNLAWNCRSCNTTLGAAFKKLGIGRRTRQYNPESGAQSVGQWVQALQSLRGEAGAAMEPAAALEMVRATPADKRSEFAAQIWRTRRSRYGATGRQNPEGPAAELYEKFHGKASERIDIVEEEIHYHEHLTALGDLVELKIKTPTKIRATLRFPDEGAPTLASSEDGRQLFVVGGDQKVNLRDIEMDSAQWRRDMMDLGELLEVTYHTVKGFHKFEPTNYFHKLGEETGVKPRILYDTRNERLLVAGGQYAVKPEGIVN